MPLRQPVLFALVAAFAMVLVGCYSAGPIAYAPADDVSGLATRSPVVQKPTVGPLTPAVRLIQCWQLRHQPIAPPPVAEPVAPPACDADSCESACPEVARPVWGPLSWLSGVLFSGYCDGCGPIYWGDFWSGEPVACDHCDYYGNWIGPEVAVSASVPQASSLSVESTCQSCQK